MKKYFVFVAAMIIGAIAGCKSEFPVIAEPPNPATALRLTMAPSSLVAGSTFSLTVEAIRADGSIDDTYTGSITITPVSGAAQLSGTLVRNAVGGVATFSDLAVNQNGTWVLSAVSGVLTAATTPAITVTAAMTGAATKLGIVIVTTPITVGQIFTLKIRALRADNSVDTTYTQNMSFSKLSGAGELSGTLTRAAVKGEARFEDLKVDAAGNYVVGASSDALPTASSTIMASFGETVIRRGTFQNQNGYITEGSVEIIRLANGSEVLRTGSDFRVSGGLGSISIWLAKSSGRVQPSNTAINVKLGTLNNSTGYAGVYNFALPASGISDFTHVVTFCDGASVNFGFSQLQTALAKSQP
ncbi:MAG: hypothetical protein IAF08_05000 [Rhizobacter sp.]|nr:hypothetical protein [Chlorobiales bacterium]